MTTSCVVAARAHRRPRRGPRPGRRPPVNAVTDASCWPSARALIVLIGALAPWWVGVVVAAAATGDRPRSRAHRRRRRRPRRWRCGTGRARRPSRVVMAASFGPSPSTSSAEPRSAGCWAPSAIVTFAAARAGLRHRHPPPLDPGAPVGVGRARRRRAVRRCWRPPGFAYEAAKSRHDLASGLTNAELGVAALEDGRFEDAAGWFREATGYLEAANARLDKPWARAAAVVPIAAIYQSAVSDMSHVGADGATVVADALDQIDFDRLRPQDGRFDLAGARRPAGAADDRCATRSSTCSRPPRTSARRGSSTGRRTSSTTSTRASSEHLPALQNALRAIELAPEMLGADGPRTYLLLFTTPSESRALGGFIGSYAELTVTDGQLVARRASAAPRTSTPPSSPPAPRSPATRSSSRSSAASATTPTATGSVGDAAVPQPRARRPTSRGSARSPASSTRKTTGRAVDGVIAHGPRTSWPTLLGYTGTVHLDSLDQDVTPENAAASSCCATSTSSVPPTTTCAPTGSPRPLSLAFEGLIDGALPEPIELARDLAPLASERRLLVWSAHPEEQAAARDRRHRRRHAGARRCRRLVVLGVQHRRQQDRQLPAAQGRLRARRPTPTRASPRARCASSSRTPRRRRASRTT